MTMLLGVLGFIAFLVVGTVAVLAMTIVGIVLVPLGLVLSPAVALALVLLLRGSKTAPTETRPEMVERHEIPAPKGRSMPLSPSASGEASAPVVKRAA